MMFKLTPRKPISTTHQIILDPNKPNDFGGNNKGTKNRSDIWNDCYTANFFEHSHTNNLITATCSSLDKSGLTTAPWGRKPSLAAVGIDTKRGEATSAGWVFSSEDECFAFLHQIKWPVGFQCLYCGHRDAYEISTRRLPLYECKQCAKQFSLTAGSIMDKSRTPLHKWLQAIFVVATTNTGIFSGTNAVRLANQIKVSYKTAWAMLNKIRQAISDGDCKCRLSGKVELALDVYLRQIAYPSSALTAKERPVIVAAMSPLTGEGYSYVKIKLLSYPQPTRIPLRQEAIDEFAFHHLNTQPDQITCYHWRTARSFSLFERDDSLFGVSQAAFEWIGFAYRGIASNTVQPYLDEYCFRYNFSRKPAEQIFRELVRLCLLSSPKDK
jgi:transposase-like protein